MHPDEQTSRASSEATTDTDAYIAELRKRVEFYRHGTEQYEQEAARYRLMLKATEAALEVLDRPQPTEREPGTGW